MRGFKLPYKVYKDLPEPDYSLDPEDRTDEYTGEDLREDSVSRKPEKGEIGYVADGRGGKYLIVGKVIDSTGKKDQSMDWIGPTRISPGYDGEADNEIRDFLEDTIGMDKVKEHKSRLEQEIIVLTDDG